MFVQIIILDTEKFKIKRVELNKQIVYNIDKEGKNLDLEILIKIIKIEKKVCPCNIGS
jgi:hypothetical protein